MRLTVFDHEAEKLMQHYGCEHDYISMSIMLIIGEAYSCYRLDGWQGVKSLFDGLEFDPVDMCLHSEYTTINEYLDALRDRLKIHFDYTFGIGILKDGLS